MMRLIDVGEVVRYFKSFIDAYGFDPKDARFSIRDIEMNLWNIPTIEPTVNEWIPVSEKLPVKPGHYLCSFKEPNRIDNIFIDLAYWTGGIWYGYLANEIVAWQPLPEPYEVKEE